MLFQELKELLYLKKENIMMKVYITIYLNQ